MRSEDREPVGERHRESDDLQHYISEEIHVAAEEAAQERLRSADVWAREQFVAIVAALGGLAASAAAVLGISGALAIGGVVAAGALVAAGRAVADALAEAMAERVVKVMSTGPLSHGRDIATWSPGIRTLAEHLAEERAGLALLARGANRSGMRDG